MENFAAQIRALKSNEELVYYSGATLQHTYETREIVDRFREVMKAHKEGYVHPFQRVVDRSQYLTKLDYLMKGA